MSESASHHEKLRVLIAGGGVAALETALALADLAPDRTDVTVIAPNTEFVYRPMTVREPFAYGSAQRYPLARIVRDAGAKLLEGELGWIDPSRRPSTPRPMRRSGTTCWCWHSERQSPSATPMP